MPGCSQGRKQLDIGVTIRAIVLTTIPDSTSQKFLVLGTSPRGRGGDDGRHALVFLDFAPLQTRQCKDSDFEKWYARGVQGNECLMGHKVSPRDIQDRRLTISNGIKGVSLMRNVTSDTNLRIRWDTKRIALARKRITNGELFHPDTWNKC